MTKPYCETFSHQYLLDNLKQLTYNQWRSPIMMRERLLIGEMQCQMACFEWDDPKDTADLIQLLSKHWVDNYAKNKQVIGEMKEYNEELVKPMFEQCIQLSERGLAVLIIQLSEEYNWVIGTDSEDSMEAIAEEPETPKAQEFTIPVSDEVNDYSAFAPEETPKWVTITPDEETIPFGWDERTL